MVTTKLCEHKLTAPAKTLNRGAEARPQAASTGPAPAQRYLAFHLTTSSSTTRSSTMRAID